MRKRATATGTEERPVMNVRQTAEYIGVSESLVWKMIREKKLQPARFGDRVLFHRDYVDRVLCGGR
jgi:excisionase family DNA binding protein